MIGRKTYLTAAEESLLVKLVKSVAVVGVPFTKDCLITIIDSYLHENKPELFKEKKTVGREWFRSFLKRHGNALSERIPQNLPAIRAKALTQFVASKWFDLFESTVKKLALDLKPECIWNVDETGLSTDIGRSKVLCAKGMQNPHRIVPDEGKSVFTVVGCGNAAGDSVPLLVVYDGKNLWDDWCLGGLDSFRYAVTENGWMDGKCFYDWFCNNFLPFIRKTSDSEHHVLILDGHSSHIGYGLAKKAAEEKVTLLLLPSHTSHALQPLDVGVYKPVKAA